MNDFLTGLLLGLAYAAPIGPQNSFLIASATSLNSRRSAFATAAVVLNDITLAAICFWGMGAVLAGMPGIKTLLLGAGALWLARLGINSLRQGSESNGSAALAKASSIGALAASAFLLTWCNPQALLDGSLILGGAGATVTASQRAILFLGVASGSALWFTGLTIALAWIRRSMPSQAIRYLHCASGVVMLAFAGKMAFQTAVGVVGEAHAAPARSTVKVAILDNLQSEKLASERYVTDYLNGIALGQEKARAQGIEIETREFFFGRKGLEVLEQAQAAAAWKPDVVIAPRSSDLFLMLRDRFPETLVLSPLASAEAVATLPANFFSMTPSNSAVIAVFARYVSETFPGRGIYQIVQADCVNCLDFARQFASVAKSLRMTLRNEKPSLFISSSVETVDLNTVLAGYQPGDLILLPNSSYASGILMAKTAEHLKSNDLIFLGGDGWGDWKVGYAGKIKVPYEYAGYRLIPWSIKKADASTSQFVETYQKRFGEPPNSNISQITYAVTSAIAALAKSAGTADRAGILGAFSAAKLKDPDFARPSSFALFKVTQAGEEYVGAFSRSGVRALENEARAKGHP